MLYFLKTAEGFGEQRVPQLESADGIYFQRGKAKVSRLLPMELCTPKKTGAAKLTLQSKVLDPMALYFGLFVKGLNEMSL